MSIKNNRKKIVVAYSAKRLSVNNFFAQRLIQCFNNSDAFAELLIIDDVCADKIDADICVMRTDNYAYSERLSNRGIKVFNAPFISLICNDKHKTLEYVNSNGFKILESNLFDKTQSICAKDFPLVAKSRYGHGGTQVFFCSNMTELLATFDIIGEKDILIQRPASVLGKDLRVYIMGGKIIASVLRSSALDFRSNFSLGGKAEVHQLSNADKKLVQGISDLFPKGFFGIDFLFDGDGLVLNEIEDVVGTRMLYTLRLLDAAELYTNFILSDNS